MSYGEGLRRNRCGVWCWRWVVPADVRDIVGATELLRSLGTASKRDAAERALPLRMAALAVVHHTREGRPLSELSKQQALFRLISERKAQAIEADERAEAEEAFQRELAAHKAAEQTAKYQDDIRKRDKVIMLLQQRLTGLPSAPAPIPAAPGPVLSVAVARSSAKRRRAKSGLTRRWSVGL